MLPICTFFTEGPTANEKTKVGMSFGVISDICITGKHCIVALHFLKPFPSTPSHLSRKLEAGMIQLGKLSLWKDLDKFWIEIYIFGWNKILQSTVLQRTRKCIWVSTMKTGIWRWQENLITICYQWIKNPFRIEPVRDEGNLLVYKK